MKRVEETGSSPVKRWEVRRVKTKLSDGVSHKREAICEPHFNFHSRLAQDCIQRRWISRYEGGDRRVTCDVADIFSAQSEVRQNLKSPNFRGVHQMGVYWLQIIHSCIYSIVVRFLTQRSTLSVLTIAAVSYGLIWSR
jgi:hypothetical protein